MTLADDLEPITQRLTKAMREYSEVAEAAAAHGQQIEPMQLATQNLAVATSVALGDLIRLICGDRIDPAEPR